MKLIFEYEEETTEHVPDVDDNKERERTGKEAAAEDITIELPKDSDAKRTSSSKCE